MKNVIYLTVISLYIGCKDSSKSVCETSITPKNIKYDSEKWFDKDKSKEAYNEIVDMSKFDTIYRYSGVAGWGQFQYFCSVYKQKNMPQYKIQLYKNLGFDSYKITENSIDSDQWQYLIDKFKNLKIKKEDSYYGCNDCNSYSLEIKEGKSKKDIHWNDIMENSKDSLKALGVDMLEMANYPTPYALIEYKELKDSIFIKMSSSDHNYGIFKKFDFKTDFKKSQNKELTIHKKDFDKIYCISMIIELYNGKIIETLEKKITNRSF